MKQYFFAAVCLLFITAVCVQDFLCAQEENNIVYSGDETKIVSEEVQVIEDYQPTHSEEDDFIYIGNERKSRKQIEAANAANGNKENAVETGEISKNEPVKTEKSAAAAKKTDNKSSAASKTGAQPAHEPIFAKAIRKNYDALKANPKVKKYVSLISDGWKDVKAFVAELPGISHYLNSKYSNKNYKKEMGNMSDEYSPHLKNDSAGVQKVKQGTLKF